MRRVRLLWRGGDGCVATMLLPARSVFDFEDFLKFAMADSIHARMQINGPVAVMDPYLDLLPGDECGRHPRIEFNQGLLGVQSGHRRTIYILQRRQSPFSADRLHATVKHRVRR